MGVTVDVVGERVPVRTVDIPRGWWSWAGAQGGAVIGHALDAMADLAGPGVAARSITAHLLRPVQAPLSLAPQVLRRGARATAAAVSGTAGGRSALHALATFGADRDGPSVAGPPPPPVARPEDCPVFELPAELVPFGAQIEVRPTTDARPMAGGPDPELEAWLRLRDDRPLDPAALCILLDALPPGLSATATEPAPVPTVDFTAHFSPGVGTAPGRGWVLAHLRTVDAGAGWSVDDSTLWSPDGRRLAVARQARIVASLQPRP